MAEELRGEHEPDTNPRDDVLGKIDQLLNRHRPKPAGADTGATNAESAGQVALPLGDGIPVLTDVVAGPGRPAMRSSPSHRTGTLNSAMLIRRLSLALDEEHVRLAAKMGGDAGPAGVLDQLIAELKRALPAAVRAAVSAQNPEPPRSAGERPL